MMRNVWAHAVLLGVLAVGAPSAAASRVDQARADVLDDDYQPELPRYHRDADSPGAPVVHRPLPMRRAGDRTVVVPGRDRDEPAQVGPAPGALGTLLHYLLWALAIVGAVIAASWLANEVLRFTGDAALPDADDARGADAEPDRRVIDRPLGDAEELAAQGRYAEAIHTLLLRTLQELVRSASVRVAPADTSREILARVPLAPDARAALGGLITAVEVTHFGDDVPGADDFDRCRQQFHRFATAFRGGRA